jgi:DNA-binding beta-propeller fold protein YncE
MIAALALTLAIARGAAPPPAPAPTVLQRLGGSIRKADPAALNYPSGLALDPARDRAYVMDLLNNQVQIYTLAGTPIGRFPCRQGLGLAVDPATGELWAAMWNSHAVHKYGPDGTLRLTLGTGKPSDAPGAFRGPHDVAVDPRSGEVYVLDTHNARVQVFSREGALIRAFPGPFVQPFGIALHPAGDFLVVASTADRAVVKMSLQGEVLAHWKRKGSGPGEFRWPRQVHVEPDGTILVADTDNERLQRLSPDGAFLGFLKGPDDRRSGTFHPRAVDADPKSGVVWAAAAYSSRVDRLDSSGRLLGHVGRRDRGGPAFNTARGVAVDPDSGQVYAADWMDHRVRSFAADGSFLGAWDLWIPTQTDATGAPLPPGFADDPVTGMWVSKEDQGFPAPVVARPGGYCTVRGSMHYPDDPRPQADQVLRCFDSAGRFLEAWEVPGLPPQVGVQGLAWDAPSGDFFVADTLGGRVLRMGADGALRWAATLDGAAALAWDGATLYVAQPSSGTIFRLDSGGGALPAVPGTFRFEEWTGLAWHPRGVLWVPDDGAVVAVRPTDGAVRHRLGARGVGGTLKYGFVGGLAVRGERLYVSDAGGHEVEVLAVPLPADP